MDWYLEDYLVYEWEGWLSAIYLEYRYGHYAFNEMHLI